jgi:hypothetical protein
MNITVQKNNEKLHQKWLQQSVFSTIVAMDFKDAI